MVRDSIIPTIRVYKKRCIKFADLLFYNNKKLCIKFTDLFYNFGLALALIII